MTENGNGKIMMDCPHCKQRFSVKMPVPDSPMNALKVSVVTATHEKPIRCQNMKCAKYFVFVMTTVEVGWAMIPITDEVAATLAESRIVIPDLPRLH